MKTILITGGAGFIGSHVVRLFVNKYPEYHIVNLDALTYAGNLENLVDVSDRPNYTFVKIDITDTEAIQQLFQQYDFQGVIHLAAESHVDRSITDPLSFIRTNILGTVNLIHAAKEAWKGKMEGRLFYLHFHRRSVWFAWRNWHVRRNYPVRSKESIFFIQSKFRSFGQSISSYVRIAGGSFELFKQLWLSSVPRKVNSALDQ